MTFNGQGAIVLFRSLTRLEYMETLCLTVGGPVFGPEGGAALAASLSNLTALRSLDLSRSPIINRGDDLVAAIGALDKLTTLRLRCHCPSCPTSLYRSLKVMTDLRELNLQAVVHDTAGLSEALATLSSLKRLTLNSGDDLSWATTLAHLKALEDLSVQNVYTSYAVVSLQGAAILVPALAAMPSLKTLRFDRIQFDETARAIIKDVVPSAEFF